LSSVSRRRFYPAGRGRHDEHVPAPLRFLRHVTAGSLLGAAAFGAALLAVETGPGVAAATVLAGTVAAILFWCGVYRPAGRATGPLLTAGALAGATGYAGAVATGTPLWPAVALPALLTAAVLTGTRLPRRPVTAIALALTGLLTVLATGGAEAGRWWAAATAVAATALCAAALMAQVWVWEVASRTDRDRVREAEAAVLRERLRFAAELHDIQGHSLQVIVLKSELAARLAAADTPRAVAQMREVEALAREALRDTREVAHGYRVVSLETEIGNAVRVLDAAGVRCRTDLPAIGELPAPAERLLALVVREATTNVIRHSSARDAEIALTATAGAVNLSVRNDGPLSSEDGAGGGLTGLAQRFASAGGALRWRRGAAQFTVDAHLPLGRAAR
jgi:two-component system sensor histidine kinase DesK